LNQVLGRWAELELPHRRSFFIHRLFAIISLTPPSGSIAIEKGSTFNDAGLTWTTRGRDIVSLFGEDLIGLEIANGRYKILGRVGHGSMGQVYLAHDRHLQTDIVLKFPFAADKSSSGPEFLDRFARARWERRTMSPRKSSWAVRSTAGSISIRWR
jgi:hypothetical protein